MDTRITGGTVRFLRRLPTQQYAHDEASAEISFSVAEGESDQGNLDRAGDMARSKVLEMLGQAPARQEVAPTVPLGRTRARSSTSSSSSAQPETSTGTTPLTGQQSAEATMKQPDAAAGTLPDPLAAGSAAPAVTSPGNAPTDPLAPAPAASAPVSGTVSPPASVASAADPLSGAPVEEDWGAQREITDKDLRDACAVRNHELLTAHPDKDATLVTRSIHDLVGKFVPPGKRTSDIPQAQRQTFLNELKVVKAEA